MITLNYTKTEPNLTKPTTPCSTLIQVPDNDTPPPPGWVHMCVRHDPDAEMQVLTFLETGCVVNYCDGACERPYCRA